MRSFVSAALLALGASAATDYTQNGANWDGLCASGTEQSPVDLRSDATPSDHIGIDLNNYVNYAQTAALTNTGYTLQVNLPDADGLNGKMTREFHSKAESVFKAVQFHVHAPSEHSVDGQLRDLEMHFVHLYEDGSLGAVLGVFFDREVGGNSDNDFIAQMLANGVPASGTDSAAFNLDVKGFLGDLDTNAFWSLNGSLTTPPCTEGIKWAVLKETQPISDAQLAQFTDLWAGNSAFAGGKGNNRVVQPLNDRTLYVNDFASLVSYGAAAAVAFSAILM